MTRISSTYRLQLRGPQADPQGRSFGFADALALLDYLQDLGISHLYLSPILKATSGSAHCYDVVDPTEINPELGGEEGFRELALAAKKAGMGIIIDIVPNHVGVASPEQNPWWWDVLKHGKASQYAHYFDIDFAKDNGAGGKIGLPVLGAEGDEHKITFATLDASVPTAPGLVGEQVLAYFDHFYPIAPGTLVPDDPVATYYKQAYKLCYWKSGVISYRRFFSVNDLAGIRQEDPEVFSHSHEVIRRLAEEDLIDGVRVDHPDGLAKPFEYLERLRDLIGPDRLLLVEKILGVAEPLDPRLRVDGTTGYDSLREFDGVFVNRAAEDNLSMLALKQTGSTWDAQALHATEQLLKADVARYELAAEVRRLARAVRRDNFSTAGAAVDEAELIETIIDLVAEMPVYRADYESLSRLTASVVADLSHRYPSKRRALDLITAAMLTGGEATVRLAQVCGAVMAKGVEDTTFYRASRLVALQEVGGAPGRFGVSAAEFHLLQDERSRLWPRAMTTLSTHDTKRDEDVRARIIALTIEPHVFAELVHKVHALVPAPDGNTGHFLLQNLLGIWPTEAEGITPALLERATEYAIKAVREAGVHTEWTAPNQAFEQAVTDWVAAILGGPAQPMITEFVATIEKRTEPIRLGRKLLQLLAPGIPDTYQGTELLSDSLVDPDNRRFVDFTMRRQFMQRLDEQRVPDPVQEPDLAKLHVTREALRVRADLPETFDTGDYEAVFAQGPAEVNCIGFARGPKGSRRTARHEVIAFAIRRSFDWQDASQWAGTTLTLPHGAWRDRLTGNVYSGEAQVADLFATYPCVLLQHIH
ncbi:malto-oligosyltrehalose synthase [Corynebacterium kozikiae]|uniref:malto-oligosyltrehalose synthase n=1 Tax=Corynebacterium kozikiae TaxID=2968469 RepID=UPI00211C7850|nr:malto-oligosyltrehalose synthase [Corynebacterium sp. 76QC2CO]MCQ9342317.1 malto-oligosyltrehalose synthase [Corynebacterium sp. 76QC2CO]